MEPVITKELDDSLYARVMTRIENGLALDEYMFRDILESLLNDEGKAFLLEKYSFGHSWYQRFCKRHNLSYRACSTKMREKPMNFEEKKQDFTDILSVIIFDNNVPPDLVINCDETNIQYVPRSSHTRAKRGTKKIRIFGVGKDNLCSQIFDQIHLFILS